MKAKIISHAIIFVLAFRHICIQEVQVQPKERFSGIITDPS